MPDPGAKALGYFQIVRFADEPSPWVAFPQRLLIGLGSFGLLPSFSTGFA